MNTPLKFAALALLGTFCLQPFTAFAQGSLTPPGAPGNTMKSLAQIEPRTPISSLPFSINSPGSYYVTTNLTGTNGAHGITIFSGNVTLDLGGFTLQGGPGSVSGIMIANAYTNVAIGNGNLVNWGSSGVSTSGGGLFCNVIIDRINVSTNGGFGIEINASIGCLAGRITRCLSHGNRMSGIMVLGGSCIIEDCSADNNAGDGIQLSRGQVLKCTAQYNTGNGIFANGGSAVVRECWVVGNKSDGIHCQGGGISGNVIADNLIMTNTGAGISLSGHANVISGNNLVLNQGGGLVIYGSNNRVENNQVQSSGALWGIGIGSPGYTNNVVVKNSVFGSSNNYINPANNDFGPVGVASSATSPWANLSH